MTWRQSGLGALGGLVGSLTIAATVPVSLLAATLTVSDCGDTVPGGAPGQLRRLIDEAAPGDVIVIPACTIQLHGIHGDNANATGDLDITKNLTIRGAGPGQTVLVGSDHPEGDRVFDILTAAGPVEISDITVTGGRGGVQNQAALTLARVHVTRNATGAGNLQFSGAGGGISTSAGASLTIRDSTVSDNTASTGGGIYNVGMLTLVNVTVSNNVAASLSVTSGGGIANLRTLDATNVTIAGNVSVAVQPGAAGIAGGFGTIRNSIIARNVARSTQGSSEPEFTSNCGPFTLSVIFEGIYLGSGGHNLSSDGTCGFLTGPGDLQNVDPALGPLAANGGAIPTHALAFGSPAIDAGDDGVCPPADERGQGRPADGTGDGVATCDIGAYEYRPAVFLDVPEGAWAQPSIGALHAAGVTAGCLAAPLLFCPQAVVTRAQMAVLLLRAAEGAAYVPPDCVTPPFGDVPCADPLAPWIAELARRGITTGCGDGNYCPGSSTTREQMAVFLLRAREGAGFLPPPCVTPTFADVPCSSPFAAWIEELVRRGITAGCSPTGYCPQAPVKREEMAVFLVRTFGLPL
jgi:hypothetical protein